MFGTNIEMGIMFFRMMMWRYWGLNSLTLSPVEIEYDDLRQKFTGSIPLFPTHIRIHDSYLKPPKFQRFQLWILVVRKKIQSVKKWSQIAFISSYPSPDATTVIALKWHDVVSQIKWIFPTKHICSNLTNELNTQVSAMEDTMSLKCRVFCSTWCLKLINQLITMKPCNYCPDRFRPIAQWRLLLECWWSVYHPTVKPDEQANKQFIQTNFEYSKILE